MAGGCAGTEHGCCEVGDTTVAKLDAFGSNCASSACAGKVCSDNQRSCPDGGPRREINGECCKCPGEAVPLSGPVAEIVGILTALQDELHNDLVELVGEAAANDNSYNSLVDSKEKEERSLEKEIEDKSEDAADDAVDVANGERDRDDTTRDLTTEEIYLEDEKTRCKEREVEHENYKTTTSEEMVALSETVKILADDDALELFKKTMPSNEGGAASFLQLRSTSKVTHKGAFQTAIEAIRANRKKHRHHHSDARVDMILLALKGKQGNAGFERLIVMIDRLERTMDDEQKADNELKVYCDEQLEESNEVLKTLDENIARHKSSIAAKKVKIDQFKAEIKVLDEEMDADAKEKEKRIESRTKENAKHAHDLALNAQSIELIERAKNKLDAYYNPTLYTDPVNQAGADLIQSGSPVKKTDSQVVIEELDKMIQELKKMSMAIENEEKKGERTFEQFKSGNDQDKAANTEAKGNKESSLAQEEEALNARQDELDEEQTQWNTAKEENDNLHAECDFLLKYYQQRKTARVVEQEGLEKAKAILNGANFNTVLLQSGRTLRHLRGFLHQSDDE